MELVDPFGWHRLDGSTLLEIQKKLGHFETMTWFEILVKAKKQYHSVPVTDLTKAARDRLEEIGLDDVDRLISLRLSGQERVWGVLYDHVLSLIWWDPEHQICPSLKKHT